MHKPHIHKRGEYWHCDNSIVAGVGLCVMSAYMSMLAELGRYRMSQCAMRSELPTVRLPSSGELVRTIRDGYPHLP